nr:peptidase [Pseudomonadales bacterium]
MNYLQRIPKTALALSCSALLLAGCSNDSSTPTSDDNNDISAAAITEVVTQNADMAFAVYSDTVSTAEELKTAIDAFVLIDTPSNADLTTLKNLWLAAREPYGESEVWRFRAGPIDALNDDGTMGNDGDGPEGRINAWPLGEALIDYVATGTVDGDDGTVNNLNTAITGNIISDTTNVPIIDKAVLTGLNEAGDDERNVATGYHAIEFLLWGQDLNDGAYIWTTGNRDQSGGQRPVSDYNTNGGCTSGLNAADGSPNTQADSICDRRKAYLVAVSELLVDDLTLMKTAWDPALTDNHYDTFIAGGETSLSKMLEAMGRLGFGELAGERMNIALVTDSQEDEHSCFSDNTHRDILLDARGIVNTYTGSYTQVDGTVVSGASVKDLLAEVDSTLADNLQAALDDSMSKIDVIDASAKANNPFDNQIRTNGSGGSEADRDAVEAAIDALSAQTDLIEDAINALELTAGDLYQDTEEDI